LPASAEPGSGHLRLPTRTPSELVTIAAATIALVGSVTPAILPPEARTGEAARRPRRYHASGYMPSLHAEESR
jgi:hypothetical protein